MPVEPAPAPVRPELAPELNPETLAALVSAVDGDIQALLHPELGVWLIHNMAGAVPYLVLRDAWPKRERGWQLESQFDSAAILAALADAPNWTKNYRPPDPANCDDGSARLNIGPSDALDEVLDIHMGGRETPLDEPMPPPWLLQTPAQLRASGTRPLFVPARWARLQRLRAAASHHVVLDEMDAVVEFGRVDGRWYLLGIDGRHDACG
ncbi:hypothetical protein [Nannocystis pusilla]|uniref:Uncharacterized protein n=1 Tax=Nannocystis pusilla TaxID=889268 RepID=A0ABS7TWW5_9BACT|nr:hypothetical protein [Nannocystis pusilla]MBZ5712730.1 hypothetical protein [Nannocystis pusilla]